MGAVGVGHALVVDGLVVRDARVADGASIGRVHVLSWQSTYRGVFPDGFLDALDPVGRGREWAQRLTDADTRPLERVLVADVDGVLLGFASIGASQDDLGADVGELWSIYVHPDGIGRGVGRALLAAAVGVLRGWGYREAVLWVAETNAHARRFYERAGWAVDGAVKTDVGYGYAIVEVRYRTVLTS